MKNRWIAVLMVGCAFAADEKPTPVAKAPVKAEPAAPKQSPGVEAAIPDPVKALGEPTMMVFPNGIQMAVTATTEKVQAHVNQGMNHLHGGWEFEASRHFAAAMREDPDCLLAHWGMLMSLLSPSPETNPARIAVTARLLDLVDQGAGSDLERGYSYGLIKYIQEGPEGAANAFRKVAAQFPNDFQASIFAALFSRSGYDEFGNATPDQETAERSLLILIENNPQNPLPINALLTIRADGPDLASSLNLARKLCQIAPGYGPYSHLLGHYEWRCGHHGKAASAFGLASSFFENWMKKNKATIDDCPEWVKAECYRIIALLSKGEFETSYAAARQIAATPLPKARGASPGMRLLMWDAKTLPARILLRRGFKGNASEALLSLPKPEDLKGTLDKTLSFWWIDGLRLALETQRLIDEGKTSEAQDVLAALTHHGEAMSQTQKVAAEIGERSAWTRAFRALEVIASDLRGRIALTKPKAEMGTAYNWFASATDRQLPAPMLFPPMVLTPMAIRLGEYYLAVNKPLDAIESYERALTAFPNDMHALLGLKSAYEQANRPDDVSATEKKIQELRAE